MIKKVDIKEMIINHIEKYKSENEFEIEISNEELEELEQVREDFCNEVGQIIGSCKMEIRDNTLGFKNLKITRVIEESRASLMKLFIVNVDECRYDVVSSVAVLARSKEEAVGLAIKSDSFFENNIGEVEEVSMDDVGVVHVDVMYG